jgi:hypothetical protein
MRILKLVGYLRFLYNISAEAEGKYKWYQLFYYHFAKTKANRKMEIISSNDNPIPQYEKYAYK